jgi:Uncharacterised nucleotidyltransferase
VAALSRNDQDQLVRWVLAALDPSGAHPGSLPDLPLERFAMAGLATGLTALTGALAERHGVTPPDTYRVLLAEQRTEVAARQTRFAATLPKVLTVLRDADVKAVPVKGAVLAWSVWPFPDARPMADLDFIIPTGERGMARVALESAGMAWHATTPWEDTYLAWGDGTVGRTTGESAAHNGKIELHPGWVERLHDYLIDDAGVVTSKARPGFLVGEPCHLLPSHVFVAQAIGHLSASVIRAEARAVNLIDVVLLLRSLDNDDLAHLADLVTQLDARLSAPGLWLVDRYQPGVVPATVLNDAVARLQPTAVEQLGRAQPSAVFRAFGTRTTLAWRMAFTHSAGERARMLRQFTLPSATDSGGNARQQVLRLRRAIRARRP